MEYARPTVARYGPMPTTWLIEPAAAPGDPCWQGRPIWQLVVRARSAAFARLAAEAWAKRAVAARDVASLQDRNAGFENPKLYRVSGLEPGVGLSAAEFAGAPVIVLAGPMASTLEVPAASA